MSSTLTALMNGMLNGALVSAPLAGLIWTGLRLTSRRILSASARYVIWWVALAVTIALPSAFLPERLPGHSSAGAPLQVPMELASPLPSVRHATPLPSPKPRMAPGTPRFPLRIAAGPWIEWISAAWALAASLFLLRLLASCVLLSDRKARARRVPVAVSASTGRNVRMAISDEVSAPMAVGFFHPTILIPTRLANQLDGAELDFIGIHEAAHFARFDDYALVVERLLEALFALHPIVRWIARQIDLEREIACDDRVVEATGRPHPYAACLTRVAELTGGSRESFAAAAATREGSHLTRRVEMLLDKTRRTGTRWLKTRLACALVIVSALAATAAHAPALLAFTTPPPPAIHLPKAPAIPAVTVTPKPLPQLIAQAAPLQPPAPERTAAAPTIAPPVQLVLEPVQVRDPQDRSVTGLTQQNFHVFENEVEQQISYFATTDIPASLGVVSQNPDGLTLPLQEELVQLQQAVPVRIEFIESANSQLPFRDAAAAAMNRIRELQTHTTHQVILMLDAQLELPGVLSYTEGGVTLIAVSLGLDDAVKAIAPYLAGGSYLLGYTPTNPPAAGKYQRIRLVLSPPKGLPPLLVRYRLGYFGSMGGMHGVCGSLPGLPPSVITCN
jgi:beta-lactamase regulating signal transducer with metallopeptidase domain